MAVEGLSIRLYLDHNVDPRLARDVRQRGFDAVHAQEVGNDRASDDSHLQWATAHGRVVFTFDVHDFPLLAEQWGGQDRQHAGIILSIPPPRIAYGEVLRRLIAFLDTVPADEMINQVRWLDPSPAPSP